MNMFVWFLLRASTHFWCGHPPPACVHRPVVWCHDAVRVCSRDDEGLVVSLVSVPSLFIVLVRGVVGLLTRLDHASGCVPAGRLLSPLLGF